MEIIIDPEFSQCIMPLRPEEAAELENSILAEGCRDALVTWGDILIDGHNRHEICNRHGILFATVERHFESRDEAKQWIITNQLGRRNLSESQRAMLAARLANMRQGDRTDLSPIGAKLSQSDAAERANVGKRSVERAAKVLHEGTPELIHAVENDVIPVSQAVDLIDRPPEYQQAVVRMIESGEAKSVVDARRLLRREEAKAAPVMDGKYRVIYADPPWCYGDKRDGSTTGAEDHYPSMTIEELCELPVKELAEDNAVLFLWVTSPLLEECFQVVNAWGFRYKSSFIWDKVRHNMGYYNSVRHELLLVCTRGSCLPDNPKLYDSVVSIERGEHSVKPEEFRQMIDDLYLSGARIELFARQAAAPGWAVWGNEVECIAS
jgi:N6-adenosine-specific RNA methylase IME4